MKVGTDSSQQSVETKVVEFSGMQLRLNSAQPAILTEDDIMTVESVTDPNNPKASQIVLTLTPEAYICPVFSKDHVTGRGVSCVSL